jgi:WD40 repeat protein
VKLWNVAGGEAPELLTSSSGYTLAFSGDGKMLACGRSTFAEVWDITRRRLLSKVALPGVLDVSVAFAPDSKTLAAAGTDGVLYLWDMEEHKIRQTLRGHSNKICCLAFSSDGRTLATGSSDRTIKLWDPVELRERATLEGHTRPVVGIAFTPDSQTLVSGSWKELKTWDVTTGKALESWHEAAARVAVSPDGKTLAAGSYPAGIRLRDWRSKKELTLIKGHKSEIYSIAFSADSKTLATASWDGTTKLW